MVISPKRTAQIISLMLAVGVSSLSATHNDNRYFPFLERPEDSSIHGRSHLTPSFFHVNVSTALGREGGSAGLPELWGKYDLKDVIASLDAVKGIDPIFAVTSSHALDDKVMKFKVNGKARVYGMQLAYEHDFKWAGFQAGLLVPVMAITTTSRFSFDRQNSDSYFNDFRLTEQQRNAQDLLVDKIRRYTHQSIGFDGNDWDATGFGDLDAHLRWNHHSEYVMLMRSIDINLQGGVLVPTGITSKLNTPVSLSVGNNGHWGMYYDALAAFELKQDWTFGLLMGFSHLFPHTRTLRISVGSEPTIFSALTGRVRMDPGLTFKFSPYFTLGNLTDGLDFQVRYTYLRHSIDTWKDVRSDTTTISSYLNNGTVVAQKENLSKWRAHYFSFQVSYDPKEAMKKIVLDPVFFVLYDMPIGGNGIANAHQFSFGAELHF